MDIRIQMKNNSHNRGSVSMLCLFLMLMAMVISMSVTTQTLDELRRSKKLADGATALSLAEAGVEYSLVKLRQSGSYTGTGGNMSFDGGTFNTTIMTVNGKKLIRSVGTLNTGHAKTVDVTLSANGEVIFPDGAMIAKGEIQLSGQADTDTDPSTKHVAHVRSNGDISCSGQASIDGGIYAGGTVSTSGQPTCVEKVSGAPQMEFPDSATITSMQQKWKSDAQAGQTVFGIKLSGKKTSTYATPLYVNGDVDLSGQTKLVFSGPGPIYITGSVKVSGGCEVENSATMVAEETIDFSGQGVYRINGGMGTCALVSLSTDSNSAIKMSGQADDIQTGIVYAVNGGIQLSGQGRVYGAIIAATDIKSSGQAHIDYPADLIKNSTALPRKLRPDSWLEK